MDRFAEEMPAWSMPVIRLLSRSKPLIVICYLAAYVALDWISFVHPLSVSGITPWNPHIGLSFALIILFGREFAPWLFVAPFLGAVLVRQLSLPLPVDLLVVVIMGAGYYPAAVALVSRRVGFDPTLSNRRSLLVLLAVAGVSIATVAVIHASILIAFNVIPAGLFLRATAQAFVGDFIGLAIVTPFLLIVFTRKALPTWSREYIVLAALTCLSIWLVFALLDSFRFQFFYIFFIPVIWMAVRFGLEGVTTGLVLTQIGLIAAIHFFEQSSVNVVAYQALMVVLALTGLSIGVVVNEQLHSQRQIRLQQEALNRALRISTMGEFAATVAHEINQPLTAIANYVRLAQRASEARPLDTGTVKEAAGSAAEQVDRAAAVVRKLRDFIQLGRMEQTPLRFYHLVEEAHVLCRPELERYGVGFFSEIARDLPLIKADGLQIQQVLVNLLRNSAEAIGKAGRHDGRIIVRASRGGSGDVVIEIVDNGPGFDVEIAGQPITPFATTKEDGLGLGLALVRSIVEAHKGRLRISSGPRGATVIFTLPQALKEAV